LKRKSVALSIALGSLLLVLPVQLLAQSGYTNDDPADFWTPIPVYYYPPWQVKIPTPRRNLYSLVGYYSLMYLNSSANPPTAQVLADLEVFEKHIASELNPLIGKTALTATDLATYNHVLGELYADLTSQNSSGYYGGLAFMSENMATNNLPSRLDDYVTIPAIDAATVNDVVQVGENLGLALTPSEVASELVDSSLGNRSITPSWGLSQLALGNLPAAWLNAAGATTGTVACPKGCVLLRMTPAFAVILASSAMIVAKTGQVQVALVLAGLAAISVGVMLVTKTVQSRYGCAPCPKP
jgi:hypothetical protein